MPDFIRPVTKLSQEQIAALLQRIISKRAAPKPLVPQGVPGIPPPLAKGVAAQEPAPGVERLYGQLQDLTNEKVSTSPLEQAMETYMQNPERYKPVPPGPPAKHIYPTEPGGPLDSTTLGFGVANERMKFKAIEPPGVNRVRNMISQELTPTGAQAAQAPVEKVSKTDLTHLSVALDDMWQTLGGGRSASAKLWDRYRQDARSRYKMPSGKDYFVASATRFSQDPQAFMQRYPKEGRLLEQMYNIYKAETGIDLRLKGVE